MSEKPIGYRLIVTTTSNEFSYAYDICPFNSSNNTPIMSLYYISHNVLYYLSHNMLYCYCFAVVVEQTFNVNDPPIHSVKPHKINLILRPFLIMLFYTEIESCHPDT